MKSGGKLSPGEDPKHCAERELKEETGVRLGRRSIPDDDLYDARALPTKRIHLFMATELVRGDTAHEADEFMTVEDGDPVPSPSVDQRGGHFRRQVDYRHPLRSGISSWPLGRSSATDRSRGVSKVRQRDTSCLARSSLFEDGRGWTAERAQFA
jgi:ADP-ribose pyrophosphatase YjhB (NUDIX family)